jgi:hypothetical protein
VFAVIREIDYLFHTYEHRRATIGA